MDEKTTTAAATIAHAANRLSEAADLCDDVRTQITEAAPDVNGPFSQAFELRAELRKLAELSGGLRWHAGWLREQAPHTNVPGVLDRALQHRLETYRAILGLSDTALAAVPDLATHAHRREPQEHQVAVPGVRVEGQDLHMATTFVRLYLMERNGLAILHAMTNGGTRVATCDGYGISAAIWNLALSTVIMPHGCARSFLRVPQQDHLSKFGGLSPQAHELATTLVDTVSPEEALLCLSADEPRMEHQDQGISLGDCRSGYYAAAWALTRMELG